MVLIIGGAYQGKTAYAQTKYALRDAEIFTCEGEALDLTARCLRHLERFALACVRTGKEPADVLRGLDLSEKILICEDISCGVVPRANRAAGSRGSRPMSRTTPRVGRRRPDRSAARVTDPVRPR